jgi:hypothetical protein
VKNISKQNPGNILRLIIKMLYMTVYEPAKLLYVIKKLKLEKPMKLKSILEVICISIICTMFIHVVTNDVKHNTYPITTYNNHMLVKNKVLLNPFMFIHVVVNS